jgi:hypothetical protein
MPSHVVIWHGPVGAVNRPPGLNVLCTPATPVMLGAAVLLARMSMHGSRPLLSGVWFFHMCVAAHLPCCVAIMANGWLANTPDTNKGVSFASSPRYTQFSRKTNTFVRVPCM